MRFPLLALAVTALELASTGSALAQNYPNANLNVYGHLETVLEQERDSNGDLEDLFSGFSIGEHDIFTRAQITPKISFLSEVVLGPQSGHDGHGAFAASIERARLQFQYAQKHSIIVGKMHTPVNYWNDVYHHGRLFFPTIDRPTSFSLVVPIHTLGVRLQGQNLGDLKFGYDLVAGNGLSSTDKKDNDLQKSLTAAVHIKPWDDSRIGVSYYRDVIFDNEVGSHGGHSGGHWDLTDSLAYTGDVRFQLVCASMYLKNTRWESLSEFSWNRNDYLDGDVGFARPDWSTSWMAYQYVGYRMESEVLYGLVDWALAGEYDLHLLPQQLSKFGLGWRHEFSDFAHVKAQVERYTGVRDDLVVARPDKWELKVQLAYGF